MKKISCLLVILLILSLFTVAFAQERSNVSNIVTEDDNLDGWIDAFDIYMSNSIDDDGGATDWVALNAAGINSDFIVGGSYALIIDYLDTGETAGDNIFRAHITMPSNLGTGFTGDITLWYISNPTRRIMDIYGEYLETFTPQPVFDGASPLLIELNTFDTNSDDYVDKIKVRFTEPLNPTWFPQGAFDDPTTIFQFTDGIFAGIPLEHDSFETTVLPNDTYVMDIPNPNLLNGGNPTVGYVPMLPRLGFHNTMLDNPFALRDPMANLAVYGGGPYIEEAITREDGADTYIDVFFSEDIEFSSVQISDFEVVLDTPVPSPIVAFAVNGPIVTLEIADIPPFLIGINRLRLTATLCIEDIYGDQNTVITWVNIKDGISPTALSITPSDILITDIDAGAGNFSVEVVYNEDMDMMVNPTIVFDPAVSGTLVNPNPSWPYSDTFVMTYDVVDVGVEIEDIDITVNDAEDEAGNVQFEGIEVDAFEVETLNPTVLSLSSNIALISDLDVGVGNFSVTVEYSEDMDMTVNPTIEFDPDVASTLSNPDPDWSDSDTFVMTYDVADAGIEVDDIDITVAEAEDEVGNVQIEYTEEEVFSIDTDNPMVDALTATPPFITDSEVGTPFTVMVQFYEAMDMNVNPTIEFAPDVSSTLPTPTPLWLSSTLFKMTYLIADAGVDIEDIDITVADAVDEAGNIQVPYTAPDAFDIDTENPTVLSLTANPALITDSDVGSDTFTFTAVFSEDMIPADRSEPEIYLEERYLFDTITLIYSEWTNSYTKVWHYDVSDENTTELNITIYLSGGTDYPAGNYLIPYMEEDCVSVDTENPWVTGVTANPGSINALVTTFTLTVDYSENMNMTVYPTIVFDPDVSTTLINPVPLWTDSDTFVMTYDVIDNDVIENCVGYTITDAIDDPAGNTQIPFTEEEGFDINTDGPEVVELWPDPVEITDATVGDDMFTLTVVYDKCMNENIDPDITFPVENPLNTISFSYGEWYSQQQAENRGEEQSEGADCYYCYDIYVAYYDVIDVDETVPFVDVHVQGAVEACTGNPQDPYDEVDVFSIDTENPTVVSITPSMILISDSDAGAGNFSVQVEYSEVMDMTVNPTIVFDPLVPSTLSNPTPVWLSNTVFEMTYDVSDDGVDIVGIDVHVEGALDDPAGNDQVPYDEVDVFSIDTENPTVVSLTANPALITDADVGVDKFTFTVVFSEDMYPLARSNPEIGCLERYLFSTITLSYDEWPNPQTYVAHYDVVDINTTELDIDIYVSGFTDDPAGNVQIYYMEEDVVSIDTENPAVVNMTLSDLFITDVDAGGLFTVSLEYDEEMDMGVNPTIEFDPVVSATLIDPVPLWTDAFNFVLTYDIIDVGETVLDIDVHVEGALDDRAGNAQVVFDEADAFDIDTENPIVLSLTADPYLITDSDVGSDTFTLTAVFSEDMTAPTRSDPEIVLPERNLFSTALLISGGWTDTHTYVWHYDVVDLNTTELNLTVGVSGGTDYPAGNLQDPNPTWFADVASIDTENPWVTGLTPDPVLITDATVGIDMFTLTVDYSEDMLTDTTADPVISLTPNSTLTFNYGVWFDIDTYVAHYDVADVNEVGQDIDVLVEGALDDPAGNIQVPYEEEIVFSIDTANPTVVSLTAYPELISDDDVGVGQFTIEVEFSELMLKDGTADPVLTFPNEDPLNTITFISGDWLVYETTHDTYEAVYTVVDVNETVMGIDVHVDGAADFPDGNPQDPYDEADVFDIDTENPYVISVVADPLLITDSDEGPDMFTLTINYNENMYPDSRVMSDPLITFPVEDPSSTIVFSEGSWIDTDSYMAYYDVYDAGVTIWNIDVHVEGATDYPALNIQIPYDVADVFSIDTENPTVVSLIASPLLITDADVGTSMFTLEIGFSGSMMMTGIADPVITFPNEDPGTTIILNHGEWLYTDTYIAYYDVADAGVTLPDIDVHIEGAEDYPAENVMVPYEEADVFGIDTENPLSEVTSAMYNTAIACIEVEWEAYDYNGIQQVELYVNHDGLGFILADTDVTGNEDGTFSYCLEASSFICAEGLYEFYTIATDVPGNIETDIDPIVPVEVDIIATGFDITTTPESPEYGTYFSVNVAALDDAGMLDCDYSNVIHFLSNYPDDVTLPNEPYQTYGYQVYDNCISFEIMSDLVIEAYGMYPFENHSYSDPIEILYPTIEPPTNTTAYDVPGDEGGWIYIDYELSVNDPFHNEAEMPSIDYYVVESDADTTAAQNWQAVANVYLYDPPVENNASVMLQVPNGFVEYDYRMAAVIIDGSSSSDEMANMKSMNKEGPMVVYIHESGNSDDTWQSVWAYCGAAAGYPNANAVPFVQYPIVDFSFDEDTTDSSIDLNNVFDDEDLAYGDFLTFTYTGNSNIDVSVYEGIVTLTPDADWFGFEDIIFTATDDSMASVTDEVRVTVNNVNDAPVIIEFDPSASSITINETEMQTFLVIATDIDSEILAYQWFVDDIMQVDQTVSTYTYESDYYSAGTYLIKCIVDDGISEREGKVSKIDKSVESAMNKEESRASVSQEWELIVIDSDQSVVVNELVPDVGTIIIDEGEIINFSVDAFDPDGNDLEYSWQIDGVEQSIEATYDFITDENSAGEYEITLNVTDNFGEGESRDAIYYAWNVVVENVLDSGIVLTPLVSKLYQNRPNPFNPDTCILLDISENETGVLTIFNMKGQIVKTQSFNSGTHNYLWNADNCSSGVYFYRLITDSKTETKKMLLLK